MREEGDDKKGEPHLPDTLSPSSERAAIGLLAVCAVSLVIALNLTPVFNNDFWIQLAVGDQIRDTGQIPSTVLFSFTEAASNPFTAYEWLPSLAWSHLYPVIGYEGMIVLKCGLVLALFGLVVALSWQINRDALVSLVLGCVFVVAINYRSLLRPELIALLLGLANLNLLQAFSRSRDPRWLLALLPTSLLWANVHGSFLVNLVLLGLVAGGVVADEAWASWRSGRPLEIVRLRRDVGWLAAAWLGVLLVSLANPFGIHLLAHTLQLSGSEFIRDSIVEWQPIWFHTFPAQPFFVVYIGLWVLLAAALIAGWRRVRPSLLLALLPFWLLSVSAIRHGTWLAVVASYVLAHLLRDYGPRGPVLRRSAAGLLAAALLCGVVWVSIQGNVRGRRPGFERGSPLGSEALEFLEQMPLTGNVFNSYEYGDQLVYHFYPAVRVAVDSRIDAYGEHHYMEHRRHAGRNPELLVSPAELVGFMNRYDVLSIVSHAYDYRHWRLRGHAAALRDAGFRGVYRDERTVVLTRVK